MQLNGASKGYPQHLGSLGRRAAAEGLVKLVVIRSLNRQQRLQWWLRDGGRHALSSGRVAQGGLCQDGLQ